MTQNNNNFGFGEIPSLILTKVFSYLNHNDRIQASCTCRHWRFILFHPRFLKKIHFDINQKNEKKNNFFLNSLIHIVKEVEISFQYFNLYDAGVATEIMSRLNSNSCLMGLFLKPKFAIDQNRFFRDDYIYQLIVESIITLLKRRQPTIKKLDLGGCELLNRYASEFLDYAAVPQQLTLLGFATVKQNPNMYAISSLDLNIFEKCTSLQVLSIDYDIMCDEYLKTFELLPLKKLVIHVHGLNSQHTGISENAWMSFREKNPIAELYLTLIYAYEAVYELHSSILKPSMPLTHLKVLFCHLMNPLALDYVSRFYGSTFKSLVWIDYKSETIMERNDLELYFVAEDPLVMMAWKCNKLSELVLYGYGMEPYNLVGISRLRGCELKTLEVSMLDYDPASITSSVLKEVSHQLGQNWAPKTIGNIHPAISRWDIHDNIRKEFILDLIREDIK